MASFAGEAMEEGVKGFRGVDDMFRACSWPPVTPSRLRPEPPKAPSRKPSIADWEVPPLTLPVASTKRRSLTVSTLSFTGSVGVSTASFASGSIGEGGRAGSAASSFVGRGLPEDHAVQESMEPDSDDDMYDADAEDEADEAAIFALEGEANQDDNDDDDLDGFQMGGMESGQSSKVSSFIGKGQANDVAPAQLAERLEHLGAPEPGAGSGKPRGFFSSIFGVKCTGSLNGAATPPLGASPMLLSALEQVAKAEAEADAAPALCAAPLSSTL